MLLLRCWSIARIPYFMHRNLFARVHSYVIGEMDFRCTPLLSIFLPGGDSSITKPG